MNEYVKAINSEEDWNNIALASDRPVVVDFWAAWCGPCRTLAPIFDAAAEELKDQATFVKVNVDELGELSGRYGVQAIPTMVVLEGGKEKTRFVGLVSKDKLISAVSSQISAGARS